MRRDKLSIGKASTVPSHKRKKKLVGRRTYDFWHSLPPYGKTKKRKKKDEGLIRTKD